MCGILAIINHSKSVTSKNLLSATSVIRHRGPDDEGLLTWTPGDSPEVWAGSDTADSTISHWSYSPLPSDKLFKVGFGHRRLSILDLSPLGHQPMLHQSAQLAITFNGEVYNYLEIREELVRMGHAFRTSSDTEVILHAWQQWGPQCLSRFNGMFSFVLLDFKERKLFAVRDRFGVKPLYYFNGAGAIYLSSEIKQIRTSPDFNFVLNEQATSDFLASGNSGYGDTTFYKGIGQVEAGHYMQINLDDNTITPRMTAWYKLQPKQWSGSYDNAVGEFRELLSDAVSLRLRSDVRVGSCLSGGLDSSSIVCIAANLLQAQGNHAGQETVTACFDIARYDEWNFASEVIKKANAQGHRIFPSFSQLMEEMDAFVWHQDEPVGSTSVFSQWAVFKGTHDVGLKVMIDGQGADEQLAGYGGNDLALYAGLMRKGKFAALLDEAKHYKNEKGYWPKGFLLGAMQLNMGSNLSGMLPDRLRLKPAPPVEWMRRTEPSGPHSSLAGSLQENLLRQIYFEPLPALLRYEDHNSMAWSVESRTPFMDYRLVEFNLGLPEDFIYKRGLRKTILRDAMQPILPPSVANRKDKMGFVTPEEVWLKGEGRQWFEDGVAAACRQFGDTLLHADKTKQHVAEMISGKRPFDFMPWRIISFAKWYNSL